MNRKLIELKSRYKEQVAQASHILDGADGRDMTKDEETRYRQAERAMMETERAIEAEEAEQERQRTAQPIEIIHPDGRREHPTQKHGTSPGKTYTELFGHPPRSEHFESANEFLEVIHSGLAHPGIQASHGATVPSEGGYSVPDEFSARWLDTALEGEIVRPRAVVWPMRSPTRKVPGWDGADLSSGAPFGGLSMQWVEEHGTINVKQGKLRLIELKAHKGAILAAVSNELLADGIGFETQLDGALGASLGWGMDNAFIRGTGAGQPLGVLNADSRVTVAKETGQAAATIKWDNVKKMWSRMHPTCVKNAVWLCNPEAVPQLYDMRAVVQNVAGTENVGGVPVYLPANGDVSQGPAGTLMGKPVILTDKASALGSEGDLTLVDFSQYVIGLRKDVSIAKSAHVGFQTDETYFRIIVRVDGMPIWKAAYTPYKGSNTLSWCVTLAERA